MESWQETHERSEKHGVQALDDRATKNFFHAQGEKEMKDSEDLQLKAEIDEIMKNVDIIMKKIEIVIPPAENKPQAPGE